MEISNASILIWSFGLATFGYITLGIYLFVFGQAWRNSTHARLLVASASASTLWAASLPIAAYSTQPVFWLTSSILDVARYGAWYAFLVVILFGSNDSNDQRNWMPKLSWVIVVTGILAQFFAAAGWITSNTWLKSQIFQGLSQAVLGLTLVEQLFRTVREDSRWNVKPLCLALLFQFGYDLYLFSDGMMFGRLDSDAVAMRGFVHTLTIPLLMLSSERSKDWTSRIRLSQKAAFHSATLMLSGIYLLFMAGIGYYVRYFGGEWGRALQIGLLIAACIFLGIMLVSGTFRAKIRVWVGKHFFRYRYDYREEWLRFTQTLVVQESPGSMGQQVIRGLADMVESPAGTLWLRDSMHGILRQHARWNLPECLVEEPEKSSLVEFLDKSGWVINLEEYRSSPGRYANLDLPEWLSGIPDAWLIVPMTVGSDLLGFVILASSRTPISINWEVNDLLKTAACQAGSFLAHMQATEALLEARKFDAFNKMSAFVVHDLKNIVTQLSLMLKNAQRHHDNPEFQRDMLMTVDHAVEKMRQLMMQLREGVAPVGGGCGVNLADIIQGIQAEKLSHGRPIEIHIDERLIARGHDQRLERVIGHLVQNALDATPTSKKVSVSLTRRNDKAAVEVRDQGCGMSNEFIRERLFKPFQSTKETGMGIGAFESAQYVRELGGEIEVSSELGHGTCIAVVLPLFSIRTESDLSQKVAA